MAMQLGEKKYLARELAAETRASIDMSENNIEDTSKTAVETPAIDSSGSFSSWNFETFEDGDSLALEELEEVKNYVQEREALNEDDNDVLDFGQRNYENLSDLKAEAGLHLVVKDQGLSSLVDKLFESKDEILSHEGNTAIFKIPDSEEVKGTLINSVDGDPIKVTENTMLALDDHGNVAMIDSVDPNLTFSTPSFKSVRVDSVEKNDVSSGPKPPKKDDVLEQINKQLKSALEEEKQIEMPSSGNSAIIPRRSAAQIKQSEIAKLRKQIIKRQYQLESDLKADTKRSVIDALKAKFVKSPTMPKSISGLNQTEQKFLKKLSNSKELQISFVSSLTDRLKHLSHDMDAYASMVGKPNSEPRLRALNQAISEKLFGHDGLEKQLELFKGLDLKTGLSYLKELPNAKDLFEELNTALTDIRRHPMATKLAISGARLSEMPVLKDMSEMVSNVKANVIEALNRIVGAVNDRKR